MRLCVCVCVCACVYIVILCILPNSILMHTPSFYRIYGLPLFVQRFVVM